MTSAYRKTAHIRQALEEMFTKDLLICFSVKDCAAQARRRVRNDIKLGYETDAVDVRNDGNLAYEAKRRCWKWRTTTSWRKTNLLIILKGFKSPMLSSNDDKL